MRKGSMLLFLIVFLLTFNVSVLADGGGHDDKIKNATEKFRNGNTDSSEDQTSDGEDSSHNDGSDDHVDEDGHSDEEESHGEEGRTNDDSSHDDSDSNEHVDSDDQNEEDSSHDDDDESDDHAEEAIVEPGPDYIVLGAFGTINLTFLIIGIWNKWLRRKVE